MKYGDYKTEKMSFADAIRKWTERRLVPQSGYYAGRGPQEGDLGPSHLEMIYTGIKNDFGEKEAKSFLDFIENLTDLSASAFLVAFEYFYNTDFKDPKGYNQKSSDGHALSATNDEEKFGEGMGALLSGLSGMGGSQEYRNAKSLGIKGQFLLAHGRKLKGGGIYLMDPYSNLLRKR